MMENILVVDDDKSILKSIQMMFEGKYAVTTAEKGGEAQKHIQDREPDLILLDIGLPDMSGMDLLAEIRQTAPEVMVVMVTGADEARTVVKALKLGAYDYLVKPLDGQEIKITLQNALENKRLKDRIRRMQQANGERYRLELVGKSEKLKNVMDIARTAAKSVDTPLLLTGESGTGKGLLARVVHYHYSDLPGPFVTVNCTAITHELFESEIFGYERGAFTGAKAEGKKGRFEAAADGTLFLDEIGSMSLSTQAKLLGVLEDRAFYRVGGSKAVKVSARIIAASNMDLEKAVEEGRFRKDLFFRLNVVKVELPPLRERPDDIIPLTEYFMKTHNEKTGKKFTRVSPEAMAVLQGYPWPGNVRELRNVIERVVLLENSDELLPGHLSFIRRGREETRAPGADFSGELDYAETIKGLIREALRRSRGNVLEAARLLKMPPHKMRYRIKKYNLGN